jgi:hypothetical protein
MNLTGYKKKRKGMIGMCAEERSKKFPNEHRLERLEKSLANCNSKIRQLKREGKQL